MFKINYNDSISLKSYFVTGVENRKDDSNFLIYKWTNEFFCVEL